MREFYVVIKDADPYLRMAFLTGITKITKAGVFSTLNHLAELSTTEKYSTMMGYTEDELENCFSEYLDEGVERLGISRQKLLADIQDHYDGFSFDGEHHVYNPFSILCFFNEYKFKNYWIGTGLPQSLAEYAKLHNLKPEDYLNTYMKEDVLAAYEIEQAPPQSFLVQSGYLTFKKHDEYLGYILDYPNREVRDSFSELIMGSSYNIDRMVQGNLQKDIIMALRERSFDPIFQAMNRTLSNIPGKLYDNSYPQKEAYYHSILLTLLWACNLHIHAEEWTNRGVSDLVLNFEGDIWIMELKKSSAQTALDQIKERAYGGKYTDAPFLAFIGISIDTEKRILRDYLLEVQGR
jgi:hypothetical protein